MRPINLMPCACAILVLMGIQPAVADAGFDRMTDDFVLDFLALSPSSAAKPRPKPRRGVLMPRLAPVRASRAQPRDRPALRGS